MINKEKYIQQFKELYRKKEDKDLTDQEALAHFEKLVVLVEAVYQPLPKKFFQEVCCFVCKKPIIFEEFKDPLCEKEFLISGICQGCQDLTFK